MRAEVRSPLIFIHGIKGAKLSDANGSTLWLNGVQALGLHTPDLTLPAQWKDGVQPTDGVTSTGVLEFVTVIPLLFERSIYGPWLRSLETFDRPVDVFHYDWRRDNHESLAKFESFIESVKKKNGASQVQVVAHSMGGLIALAALNRGPENFRGVVFVGVPFAGGIGFLPDLHLGSDNGLNSRILSWEVLGTFPSTYTLFPGMSSALTDESGIVLPMDFFRADDWEKMKFGFFAEGRTAPPGWKIFLQGALDKAKAFREFLKPQSLAYPPIRVVIGKHLPTLALAKRGGPKAKVGWDFESLEKAPGDGRVRETSALPPDGIPYELQISEMEHADLLNDPKVVEKIRALP